MSWLAIYGVIMLLALVFVIALLRGADDWEG